MTYPDIVAAYDAHTKNLEGVQIVNCEMCECGQSTTTRQSELCKKLSEGQDNEKTSPTI